MDKSNPKHSVEMTDATPVFRVLRHSKWSLGLKLEPQFWSLLGMAAYDENQTQTEFVYDILNDVKTKNKTSYLRSYILTWVYQKLMQTREKLRSATIVRDLHIAPIPSLTVTRDCRLFSCNAEFIEFLQMKFSNSLNKGIKPKDAKISFSRPLEQIFIELEIKEHASIHCKYKVIIDDLELDCLACVAKVRSIEDNLLILYNEGS